MDDQDKSQNEHGVKDNTLREDEQITDRVSEELEINLPGKDLPTPIRIIAFFSLIGGFSIIGSLFADIVRPREEDIIFYVVRVVVGLVAVSTAYGIIEKQRWALWLYGLVTLIALFTNPFFSFIPGLVLLYLYTHKSLFTPSYPDIILGNLIAKAKAIINRRGSEEPPTPPSA